MATILSGGKVITMRARSATPEQLDIRIDGHDIVAVGAPGSVTCPEDTIVDCADTLIVPGLVNVHTHAATGIFRGMVEDVPASWWAGAYVVPGQERLAPQDFAQAARVAAAEYLLNGVTCIADRFSFMDHIAPALLESGIRAVVGQTLRDRRGPVDWRVNDAVIERFGVDPDASRVCAGLAPHALDSCSDELLAECARRSERLGCRVFVHVAQSRLEVDELRGRGHAGALECLVRTGLARPHVVAAHAIFLDDAEIDEWPRHGIAIAHCPASNLKVEARTLPIARLLGKVAIGIGTDWTASDNTMDLMAEARLAALVGKLLAQDPTALRVDDIIAMLTIDGARAIGLDRVVGSIEAGKRADIVVLDLGRLEANPRRNLAANLVHAMGVRCIRDVFVDGEPLVRAGKLTRADEAELVEIANRLGDHLG